VETLSIIGLCICLPGIVIGLTLLITAFLNRWQQNKQKSNNWFK